MDCVGWKAQKLDIRPVVQCEVVSSSFVWSLKEFFSIEKKMMYYSPSLLVLAALAQTSVVLGHTFIWVRQKSHSISFSYLHKSTYTYTIP